MHLPGLLLWETNKQTNQDASSLTCDSAKTTWPLSALLEGQADLVGLLILTLLESKLVLLSMKLAWVT